MSTLEQLNVSNTFSPLAEIFFSEQKPKALPDDFLIHFNAHVAQTLLPVLDEDAEIENLMQIRSDPFSEHEKFDHYAGRPPEWAHQIEPGCSSRCFTFDE